MLATDRTFIGIVSGFFDGNNPLVNSCDRNKSFTQISIPIRYLLRAREYLRGDVQKDLDPRKHSLWHDSTKLMDASCLNGKQ